MATNDRSVAKYRQPIYGILVAIVAVMVVTLLAVVAVSNVPMRGAELFGVLANKVKGHPGATTVICLGAGAALWLALAVLIAGQEWLAGRRKTP